MSNIRTAGPNVTQAFSGTVKSAGQLLGTNTNDDAAASFVGQYLESKNSTPGSTGATGAYFDAASLTLTAGDWDVQGHIIYYRNGATFSATTIDIGISGATGNSSTGLQSGTTEFFSDAVVPLTFTHAVISTPVTRVQSDGSALYIVSNTFNATQVVYLKGNISAFTAATPQYVYIFRARRVR